MNKTNKTYYANCFCGGIKIKIKGKLRYVSNCHCSQCMKTHGNFAAYTMIQKKNVKFLSKKNSNEILYISWVRFSKYLFNFINTAISVYLSSS